MSAQEKIDAAFTLTGDALHAVMPVTHEERAAFLQAMSSLAKLGEVLERRKEGERSDG
jgi:hypothetical protein